MKACVLYSGGKDSSLMAVILQKLGYEVELITINFGIFPSWKAASQSARNLGFTHKIMKLDEELLHEGVKMILSDGYPNNGLDYIHNKALRCASKEYSIVADGTRRDDRVPKLNSDEIRSFEDSEGVEYLNLSGFGYKTINKLSAKYFKVRKELTNMNNNSDYEIEIRHLIDEINGHKAGSKIFPEHFQSRVTGWRDK